MAISFTLNVRIIEGLPDNSAALPMGLEGMPVVDTGGNVKIEDE